MTGAATTASAAPRRRARRIVVAVVVVVVLVAAAIVADGIARSYIGQLAVSKFRSSLSVPKTTKVTATVGGASALLQLASGTLDRVDISAKKLTVGALAGDAHLTEEGIPLDQSKPARLVRMSFSTDEVGLKKLLASFPDIPVSKVSLSRGSVELGTTVKAFGLTVPVSIAAKPAAVNGQLTLQPTAFTVNGARFTPEKLTSTFGALADGVTKTQVVCVAQLLPSAFRLQALHVEGSRIALEVSAANVVLDAKLFATEGTCPAT
ncbi:MAG: hypothetical protein JWN36_2743 [Microbacteriaceae bacterium]|nr:hypothetical protein [Microbacteriaceae bacterium]